jgi:fatty acid desaturase
MTNLEEIAYTDALHPDGRTYAVWRKGLKPRYSIVWRDIVLGYMGIGIIFFLASFLSIDRPIIYGIGSLIGAVVLGSVLAYLSLFLHEAGHFNLHPRKKINDRLAFIFLGIPFGTDINSYRKIHWQHHLHLGTTADAENSYFNALTSSFLLETFTGLHLLKVLRKKNANHLLTPRMKKNSFQLLVASGLLSMAITLVFILTKFWAGAFMWLAGMFIFFPFFATLRQILEHRDELAQQKTNYYHVNHGKLTRIFTSNLFSRFFGGAGFNKHLIHHWDPQISYTRLNDIEQFLSQCPATKALVESASTTYFKTFRKLVFK